MTGPTILGIVVDRPAPSAHRENFKPPRWSDKITSSSLVFQERKLGLGTLGVHVRELDDQNIGALGIRVRELDNQASKLTFKFSVGALGIFCIREFDDQAARLAVGINIGVTLGIRLKSTRVTNSSCRTRHSPLLRSERMHRTKLFGMIHGGAPTVLPGM